MFKYKDTNLTFLVNLVLIFYQILAFLKIAFWSVSYNEKLNKK